MLIGLCSLKSSPGVTTTTLALAGCWPVGEPPPTVIELDTRGGDLAWRYGLPADPGLRSLAAASRLRPDPSLLIAHARAIGGAAVPTVTAPVEPDAARQAVAALKPLLEELRDLPEPVLLDLGMVDPSDPRMADLLSDIAEVLVVARAVPEQLARLNAGASGLRTTCRVVKALFIGNIGMPEVAMQSVLPVAGVLPLINPDASLVARMARRRRNRAFGIAMVKVSADLAALARNSELSDTAVSSASLSELT